MDAPLASTSALPLSGTEDLHSAVFAPLDVETTNWNAVKIIAAQHHIPISLVESIRDTVTTQSAKHADNHDFGADTPFHISAARLETGRVVFRFRSRQPASTLHPDFGSSDARQFAAANHHDGMPRSSSSGAIFTQPQSDPIDSTASTHKSNISSSLLRMTGNLSLKNSRSIPVLRRKPSATFGPSPFANVGSEAGSSGGASPAFTSTLAGSQFEGSTLPLASSSRTGSGQHPNAYLKPHHAGGSSATLMSRTGSSPVSGPYANRCAADQIEEGDVLGAVLGLGKADLWAKSPFHPQSAQHQQAKTQTRRRRSSSSSSSASLSNSNNTLPPPPELRLPELSFDSNFAKAPRIHHLREVHSFESNASDATARGEDKEDSIDRYPSELQPFLRRTADDSSSYDAKALVFDVIQCYHRPSPVLPMLGPAASLQHEHLLSASATPLGTASTAHADQPSNFRAQAQALPTSASPGDDPRFAIWAVPTDTGDGSFVVSNRDGQTDADQVLASELASSTGSSPASTTKRRSRLPFSTASAADKRSSGALEASSPASERNAEASTSAAPRGKAMLLAASAARLVAELTAEIDLTLRSDFFYTYREFMTPLDLLELLILRFEWAVSEPSSAADEARRRIVRVRTYVVIKHWLQHHFDFDFLPNRALRQRLATWLNTIAKDERIAGKPADLNIVNSLRKIVRALKETYSQSGVGGLLLHDSGRLTDSPASRRKTDSISTFGSSSHDSQPSVGRSTTTASSDEAGLTRSGSSSSMAEDVDLDLSEDQSSHDDRAVKSLPNEHGQSMSSSGSARADPARAAQKAAAESVLVSQRHTIAPASFVPPKAHTVAASTSPAPLPHPSNAWSRAFVQTVGRLSKFKRVLNNRGYGPEGHIELDAEAEECSDLLFAKGGLESLLQYFAVDQARRQSSSMLRQPRLPRQRPLSRTEEANEDEEEYLASQASEDSTGQEETPSLAGASTNRSTPASSIDLSALSDKHHDHYETDPQGLGISQSGRDVVTYSDETQTQAQDLFGLDTSSIRPLESLTRPKPSQEEHLHHAASEQTLRSVSRAPAGTEAVEAVPAARRSILHDGSMGRAQRGTSIRNSVMSNGAPRIVQIDDIDLSSDEDDFAVRKALRRLPGARDLRQANTIKDLESEQLPPGRESIDSMASSAFRHPAATRHVHMGSFGFGHTRGVSVDSAMFVSDHLGAAQPAPPMISTVQSEMLDPDEALQGYELVKGFRLDDIESDDEEPGDVEAALRRLEGIIDEDRQKQKANRVEKLWQRSLARNARNDAAVDDDEAAAAAHRFSQASVRSKTDHRLSSSLTAGSLADAEDELSNASAHPCDRSSDVPAPGHAKSLASPKKKIKAQASFLDLQDSSSASEDEGDEGALQAAATKRASSVKSAEAAFPPPSSAVARQSIQAAGRYDFVPGTLVPPPMALAPVPPVHHSFLLSFRSESVARQMCLIEAELLRSVTWDELASSRWRERRFGAEVTDWEAFYRDRVRDRLEAQRQGEVHQERAVEAIVARFNLTSNWVASEVVLTQNIDERAAVISKLIRVAWKCYLQSNFASLAQIIFGLSTPWVERLRRTWNRVGYFEMRMWRDLNSFVGPRHNFRHLRKAMLQLVEGTSGEGKAGSSGGAGEAGRGCIPFFGLFVSDLMQYDAMPTLLDPTAPTLAASTTTTQDGKVRLFAADPSAFADLAPLPPAVQLEPLINVLKFRSIAEVIRQISAFQSAAKNYSAMFEAEKGAYVRCLKLRCLPGELLARLSHMVEP